MKKDVYVYKKEAEELLEQMIKTPSLSRNEDEVADLLCAFLADNGVIYHRKYNNVWAYNKNYDRTRQTLLLCSHHDTVPPGGDYTFNPFYPGRKNGRIYGLGSNDAGASLVSLLVAFLYFYEDEGLNYNLCLALVGEEEVSGDKGVTSILPHLENIAMAVVGEPTSMKMAVAERGLMVLDCVVKGRPGHAAHGNTVNPITEALPDLQWFSTYKFGRVSDLLGEVKMNVTVIHSGEKHNSVPADCRFTVDVRTNELYTNEEVLKIISNNVQCEVTPRSTRLNPSRTDHDHPLVKAAKKMGIPLFGSGTLSDQALLPFPGVKIGVGDSLRSHTPDEYIQLSELYEGIDIFLELFTNILVA